jgi:hypothetical protein
VASGVSVCGHSDHIVLKPHIELWEGFWVCHTGSRRGRGKTPFLAYKAWLLER